MADFDPVLEFDGELDLTEVTPELFHALQLLEPFGMGNAEPVFAARGVQLVAPPKILKDKHVKLKLRAGEQRLPSADSEELTAAAILATPRCHPDSAAIRRSDRAAALAESQRHSLRTDFRLRSPSTHWAGTWQSVFRQSPFLAGDSIDIAFCIGHNDHPEYGGLELTLKDLYVPATTSGSARPAAPSAL